tara:strand:- start:2400 stop:2720 length:321 start_codon:yes stop_codon:yes gene_type:complete
MAAPRTTSEAKLEEDENPSKKRKISPAVEVSVIKASSSSPLRPPVLRAPKITPFTSGRPCRSVDNFERLNKIEEGTYGVVYRARLLLYNVVLPFLSVVTDLIQVYL